MLTLYSIYIVLLFVIVAIGIALAAYAWQHRRTPGATAFLGVMLDMVLWSFALAMLAFTDSPEAADFWGRTVRLVALVTMPALLLVFVIQYTGREKWLSLPRLALLFIIPLISLVLTWSGEAHYLFIHYASGKVGPYTFLGGATTSGPWLVVHMTYSYLAAFLGIILLLLQAFGTRHPYRGQTILLLVGFLIPMLVNLLDTFTRQGPRPTFAPIGFAVMGLIYVWALFRYRLLDIVPIARDLIIDNMDDAVLVVDAHQRVVDLNPAARMLIGQADSGAIGQSVAQVLPAWSDAQERLQDGRLRTEIVMGEGESIHVVSLTRQPIRDQHGDLAGELGILRDITGRKRAEQALRESEALLSKSQAIAHIGSWELDLVTNRLTWSDEVYRMFGLRPQEFGATYEAFLDTVHPDDRAAVDAAYAGSLREGRDTYEIEHRIIRRDSGEVRVVHEKCEHAKDASGRIVRSVGMVQDITELKQAQERRATLYLATREISASIDENEICATLHRAAAQVMPVDTAVISLRIDGAGSIRDAYLYDAGKTRPGERYPLGSDLASYIITTCQSLCVDDLEEASTRLGFSPVVFGDGCEQSVAVLAVPLQIRGHVTGMMAIESHTQGYTAEDQELLEILAAYGAAAFENARLYRQAQELAVSEERDRLARDLHDSVTQTLYSVALTAEALPRVWEQKPDEALKALHNLHRLARGALGEMRSLLLELRPAILLEKDLGELLCHLADGMLGWTQIAVETEVRGGHAPPDEVRVALYRIVQEALNNVVKHAAASRVIIKLDLESGQVVLGIQDDGRGFDPRAVPGHGFGVRNMVDRAKDIGAEFHLESRPGKGTQIQVVWNPPREPADEA